jgi:hypothetical protein
VPFRDNLKPRTTDDFLANFSRVAQTSHYKVEFRGIERLSQLSSYLRFRGVDNAFVTRDLGEYCRAAQLPGTQIASRGFVDQFPGVTENFAYRRNFQPVTMRFYVDYEYKVQKFFELWQEYILSGSNSADGVDFDNKNYYYRVKYPDSYKCERIRLVKYDRDHKEGIEYNFLGAYPKNIASTPVSYDASRVLEVTVTFEYDRYIFGAMDSYSKSLRQAFNQRGEFITFAKPSEEG